MAYSIDIAQLNVSPILPEQPSNAAVAAIRSSSGQSTSEQAASDAVGGVITGGTHDGVSVVYDSGDRTLDITNTDKGSVAVTAHEAALDPHPQYETTAEVAAQITTHSGATDPHGDRAFATSEVSTHTAATDPHGDRAYADSAVAAQTIDGHSDVTVTAPANGEVLTYNGSAWVNVPATALGAFLPLTGGSLTGPLQVNRPTTGAILEVLGKNTAEGSYLRFGTDAGDSPNVMWMDHNWDTGTARFEMRTAGVSAISIDNTRGVAIPNQLLVGPGGATGQYLMPRTGGGGWAAIYPASVTPGAANYTLAHREEDTYLRGRDFVTIQGSAGTFTVTTAYAAASGRLRTDAGNYYTALSSLVQDTAPLSAPQHVAVPNTAAVKYIPAIQNASYLSGSGYIAHLSIGQYRNGVSDWGGGVYLAYGGHDNYPTSAWHFSNAGVVYPPSGQLLTANEYVAGMSGNGQVRVRSASAVHTGFLEFMAANGNRQGYIGFSTSTGSGDTGQLPIVCGQVHLNSKITVGATPHTYFSAGDMALLRSGDTGGAIWFGQNSGRFLYGDNASLWVGPTFTSLSPYTDNVTSLGFSSQRYTVVYATTGTINTSDRRMKRDILPLEEAERQVAVAIKGLVKKFRWKDAYAEKGEKARVHIGFIAQEVEQAFKDAGLSPRKYALFCEDEWYELPEDTFVGPLKPLEKPYVDERTPGAVKTTRQGLRHDQLLAFLISAL